MLLVQLPVKILAITAALTSATSGISVSPQTVNNTGTMNVSATPNAVDVSVTFY